MRRPESLLAAFLAAASPSFADQGFAVVGATVVNGTSVLADGIVVVARGRIQAVGPRSHVRLPKGVTLQDGRGLFVVAGAPWSAAAVARVLSRVHAGAAPREAVLEALRGRAEPLAPGDPAEFVVLDKDPLRDPEHLRTVVRAVRDGRELDADARRDAER